MLEDASVLQNHSNQVWAMVVILDFLFIFSQILIESGILGMSLDYREVAYVLKPS
jgi:hypothetical protein